MIHFGERYKLSEQYMEWIKEHEIADSPFNMVCFFSAIDIIDEHKLHRYLDNHKEKPNNESN